MSRIMEPTGWQAFNYSNPPKGLCWLEVERPETWCDTAYDGSDVGGYTGKTHRLVVLADVQAGECGPEFEWIEQADCGTVDDNDTVLRFLPLTPPELPA